ncbi:LCP family protein [Neobacillus kokaensis]|uniref:Regulatory protein MsrR n=1 Tax=Neobacillus kokaensis TaxID=2759023 RepID=A0ABQ3N768_9BACI|nr:LCP family protein [Neobacillus kokaensis]GHI00010.1 transcriptional regulator [Neobacillus kokaensis]
MSRRNRKVRVKWGRVVGAFFFIGIFMVGLFSIYQYVNKTVQSLNQPFKKVEEDHFVKSKASPPIQKTQNKIDAVNVLILGSDSRGEKQARTDTIMVGHYNLKTHEVKLISLMRDMYVSIPQHGQQKLNAAYSFGGAELLRETLKENFGLDIHYYAMVDFKGFEKAVDLLVPNGIEVDIPHEMSEGIDMTLEKGKQTLHGKELLGYVRFRKDQLSDFGRVQRQQEVISKLKEEAMSLHSVAKLPELLEISHKYIDTNIEASTLLTIGKDLLANKAGDVESLRIPEDGSFENKQYDDVGQVLEVDLDQNKKALEAFLGETE